MSGGDAEGPILDPAAFVRMREWGGDELLRKMIELFIQNTPKRMDQIRTGVAELDADAIEGGAHSLKSSCGNLGAERTRALAQRMEDFGEDSKFDEAKAILPDLEESYAATLKAMIRARDRRTTETPE